MPSIATKTKILDSAERLFARQGFAATSLRNVISDAGVNLAAVHYHFGSKEGLISAVLKRRFGPVNEERLDRLAALRDSADRAAVSERDIPVRDIVAAFVRPVVPLSQTTVDGEPFLSALAGRMYLEGDSSVKDLFFEQFDEVAARFIQELERTLTGVDPLEVRMRFHFLVGTMASALLDPNRLERLTDGRVDPARDMAAVISSLESFVSAAFEAPASLQSSKDGDLSAVSPPGASPLHPMITEDNQ